VYVKDGPAGVYHCIDDPAAAVKVPTPLEVTMPPQCTVDGVIVPPSTIVELPNSVVPALNPILDMVMKWRLAKNIVYTKTVNMIHIGDSPGAWIWGSQVLAPGTYNIQLCVKEIPEPPAAETNWANNSACTPYVLTVLP